MDTKSNGQSVKRAMACRSETDGEDSQRPSGSIGVAHSGRITAGVCTPCVSHGAACGWLLLPRSSFYPGDGHNSSTLFVASSAAYMIGPLGGCQFKEMNTIET